MKKNLKNIFNLKYIIILVVIIVAIIVFWLIKEPDTEHYITTPATIGSIRQEVNASGEISAAQLITVGAQVSGKIEKLNVKLGQEIKKGDLIAQIDSTTQENDYAIEKAKLDSYNAQLEAAQVKLTIAKSQYDREAKLYRLKSSSKQSLEEMKSTYADAKATVANLTATIKQTEIALKTAEVNLGYTKIVAPIDGTVVSIPVEEGQTVNAATSTPTIIQVADLNLMEILMEISEGDITKVKAGMPVTYSILSAPDKVYKTELKSIDSGLTTLTNGSYERGSSSDAAIYYYGRLEVTNENGALRIGMTTQNTIELAHIDNVIIAPSIAIHKQNGNSIINILNAENKIEERIVNTGLSDSMNTQIISGLNEGDQIVLSNMSNSEISSMSSSMSRPRMR